MAGLSFLLKATMPTPRRAKLSQKVHFFEGDVCFVPSKQLSTHMSTQFRFVPGAGRRDRSGGNGWGSDSAASCHARRSHRPHIPWRYVAALLLIERR